MGNHQTTLGEIGLEKAKEVLRENYKLRGLNPDRVNNNLVESYILRDRPVERTLEWKSAGFTRFIRTLENLPRVPFITAIVLGGIAISYVVVKSAQRPFPSTFTEEWRAAQVDYDKFQNVGGHYPPQEKKDDK